MIKQSRSGFILYVNITIIKQYSKKQSRSEASIFDALFVAIKHGINGIRDIRYRLRMMGMPISCPTHVYDNNTSVFHHIPRPKTTLKQFFLLLCSQGSFGNKTLIEKIMCSQPYDKCSQWSKSSILYPCYLV